MCGIIGYSSNNPTEEHFDILQKLILQSKIRGLHSFGFSYVKDGLKTVKKTDVADIKLPMVNKLIFHNRYSTSGDYKIEKNNQPIISKNNTVVFNGVLDMSSKLEMEKKYNVNMYTENDGELISLLCGTDKEKIKDFITTTSGSIAGMQLTDKNKLYLFRNENRPAWILKHKNAIFIASTKDIFQRVDASYNPESVAPYKIYEL